MSAPDRDLRVTWCPDERVVSFDWLCSRAAPRGGSSEASPQPQSNAQARKIVTDNILVTIPISHYCEKARWALDRAHIAYVEQAHVQAIHRFATRRAGGGLTAPVLRCADGALADSRDILAWADAQSTPARALYPKDPDRAAVVRRLEDYFDTRLGPQSRCWLYQQLRGRRDLALDYGCSGVPAWERMTLRLGYPALIAVVAHVLDVTPTTGLRSEHEVRAVFNTVGEYLSDG